MQAQPSHPPALTQRRDLSPHPGPDPPPGQPGPARPAGAQTVPSDPAPAAQRPAVVPNILAPEDD